MHPVSIFLAVGAAAILLGFGPYMEWPWTVGGVVVLGGSAWFVDWAMKKSVGEIARYQVLLAELSAEWGWRCTIAPKHNFAKTFAEGLADGVWVRVDARSFSTGREVRWYTRISASGADPSISLASQVEKPGLFTVRADFEVGVAAFDALVRVAGEPARVLAHLGQANRAHLALSLTAGLLVAVGVVDQFIRGPVGDEATLREAVRMVAQTVNALREPADPVAALIAHAAQDPEPGFRAECLRALAALEQPSEAARAAVLQGLGDGAVIVQLAAAAFAGAAAAPTLVAVAWGAQPVEQLQAIELTGALPEASAAVVEVLTEALADEALRRAARAALEALDALGHLTPGGLALAEDGAGGLSLAASAREPAT